MNQNCCPVMDLQWTPRVIDGQFADVYFCASCGHVHSAERYTVAGRFPYTTRCVNCGGDLVAPGNEPAHPHNVRCQGCGLSVAEDKELHDRLASVHPNGDYLLASQALAEQGRYVLALKLATAATRWGTDPVAGEIQRLSVLESINEFDRALDEAYEWADNEGAPPDVHGVIAGLEAAAGNLAGAMKALERGLAVDPDRGDWWLDHAELMVHKDDRPGSLRSASKAISAGCNEARAMAVISEVGERFYANGQFAEALGACSLAGDAQERNADICWLRARISAVNQDTEYLVKWLEATLALNPEHAEAITMLEPYKKKTGWFNW